MLNTPEWTSRLTPLVTHELSKVRQLYLNLYEAITRGELPHGQQLPSSRQLSQQLGIGRNTVIAVYRQLDDEGLIDSAGRQGTRVKHKARQRLESAGKVTAAGSVSRRARRQSCDGSAHATLAPGMPDPELFPKDAWRKALIKASRLSADQLGYHRTSLTQLQVALARYLAVYRSLPVAPEQIVITSGTRQSLMLAATLYADQGCRAWVETPGYSGAADAFDQQGLALAPLPVGQQGHDLSAMLQSKAASLIYLTPCFQYPVGVALNAQDRAAILAFARRTGSVIFEDDYDSEFRDDTEARPALASQAADPVNGLTAATVLHAGTFSKLIFPAARIAWLVVPGAHVDNAYRCLRTLGGGHNTVAQATIAELLDNGSVAGHLQRARRVYAQRRQVLLSALAASGQFDNVPDTGGSLSLVAPLKRPLPAKKLARRLQQLQLGVRALQDLQWDQKAQKTTRALVLGLGNVSSLEIPDAVDRLLAALA